MAPEGRKQWPDVAIAHLTECDSNRIRFYLRNTNPDVKIAVWVGKRELSVWWKNSKFKYTRERKLSSNQYRVTLVVEYLGWDDYHFGHSTTWQRGAWQDWLRSCARWWKIQINVNQTPRYATTSHPVE